MRFYLGTHRPNWLGLCGVPLFVSHRTLRRDKSYPKARGPWALDSGGFTEIAKYGEWRTTAAEYVEAVEKYQEEIGQLDFAAPRDWMCEPHMIEKTGLSVEAHQHLTVADYLDLTSRSDAPFIPVLQGWTEEDYHACVDLYESAGVDLASLDRVGIGSVCRRQDTEEIANILSSITARGIALHGFGVKKAGLATAASYLGSADSMAWSYGARFEPPIPGHESRHKACNNCQEYALRWRDQVIQIIYQNGGTPWEP